ncbi:2OG-Fe(II) oxygenase family protein [Kitasatospora sp. NPDC101155]|uniref:2OG-Fe(II) oxygenase family protein n=1 Tax=Kitasatospora sp. NPDC101155 TaxID=3364097 RepID=UPI003814AE58
MHTANTHAAGDLLRDGYTRITLPSGAERLLHRLLGESRLFFGRPTEEKSRYASTDFNFGYRPLGREFSVTADRPDLNDCFTLWHDRLDLIPNSTEIPELTEALLAWREYLSVIVAETVGEVAAQLGGHKAPPFEAASYLQLNNYAVADSDRDLLQDKHEDGHLVTVIHTTEPGLELWLDGEARPMHTAPDEVILMPGSVLTDLTGGRIPALYHQVRNLRLANRTALMYFVNPELTEPVHSWVTVPGATPVDLRDRIRSYPAMFGLPDVPAL